MSAGSSSFPPIASRGYGVINLDDSIVFMLLPWAFSLSNSTLFTSPSKFPWRRSLISSKSEVFVWTYCQVTPVAINIAVLLLRVAKGYPQFSRSSLGTPGTIASHADALRGSSRVPFPREEGTRDEPITASAWEVTGTMTHQFSLPRSADDVRLVTRSSPRGTRGEAYTFPEARVTSN